MYLGPKESGVPRVYERVSDRWEVCVATTEGQFNQVRDGGWRCVRMAEWMPGKVGWCLAQLVISCSPSAVQGDNGHRCLPPLQVSFVNAICTSKGGTHVNYIADQVGRAVHGLTVLMPPRPGERVRTSHIPQLTCHPRPLFVPRRW